MLRVCGLGGEGMQGGGLGEGTQKGAFEARRQGPQEQKGFIQKVNTAPERCPYQARFGTKAETQPPLFPMSGLAHHTAQPCSCTASAALLLQCELTQGQEHQHAGSPSREPPLVPLQGFLDSADAVLRLTWTISGAVAVTWQQALASVFAFDAAYGRARPL